MTLATLLILAIGLSMDAFAIAISNGICYQKYTRLQMLITALLFGAFQGLMPVTGFALGSAVSSLIQRLDHIIALVLLSYLGGSMICKAVSELRYPQNFYSTSTFSFRQTVLQAIATSIDALAVGISLVALQGDIFYAAFFVSAITFSLSLIGGALGKHAGHLIGSRAQLFGGSILILIGVKIFLEHTLFN